jgi:hypothetical protein
MTQNGKDHARLLEEMVSYLLFAMASVALLRNGVVHQRPSQTQIAVCCFVSHMVLLGVGVQPGVLLSSAATHLEPNRWHMSAHVPPLVVALKLQKIALCSLPQESNPPSRLKLLVTLELELGLTSIRSSRIYAT